MASEALQALVQQFVAQRASPPLATPELRVMFEGLGKLAPLQPDVVGSPVDAGGVPAEWIGAGAPSSGPTLLYLQGGGYTIGSVATYREFTSRLARAVAGRCLVIEYRLAPEHPHPAAVDDALGAYRFLLREGRDPRSIVIAGDSAGGGLTLATLLSARDAALPLPAAAVLLSPWTDLTLSGESMRTKAEADVMLQRAWLESCVADYTAGKPAHAPLVSPLFGHLERLPPLLIQVGTEETLLDDAKRLAERAAKAGVAVELEVWPEMIHIWQFFAAIVPEGQEAVDKIGACVRSRVV